MAIQAPKTKGYRAFLEKGSLLFSYKSNRQGLSWPEKLPYEEKLLYEEKLKGIPTAFNKLCSSQPPPLYAGREDRYMGRGHHDSEAQFLTKPPNNYISFSVS